MLTQEGHLKLIDFGSSLILQSSAVTACSPQKPVQKSTFVGTAEYVSPELLEHDQCGFPADLWALGVIIYKMFVKDSPFNDLTEYLIFQKVKKVIYNANQPALPPQARDLVQRLLVLAPEQRLGSDGDFSKIKQHPFFFGIDFDSLDRTSPPGFTPPSPQIVLQCPEYLLVGVSVYQSQVLQLFSNGLLVINNSLHIQLGPSFWAKRVSASTWSLHQQSGATKSFKQITQPAEVWVKQVNIYCNK